MPGLTSIGGFSVLQNTILGPGFLAVPWAFAQCGYLLGAALLIFSALTSFCGMHLLSVSGVAVAPKLEKGHDLTFSAICMNKKTFALLIAFDLGLVLACGLALVSALMILGDSLEHEQVLTRREWILSVFGCICFPLSCFKKIEFLRFSSYLSLAMITYIVVLSLVTAWTGSLPLKAQGSSEPTRFNNGMKILQAVPVFTFGFCGHQNMIPVVNEIQDRTIKRVDVVITSALFAAFMIYSLVCAGTYASFGDLTPADLLSFYGDNLSVKIARFGMAVVCVAVYPLLVQPIRTVFLGWVQIYNQTHNLANREVALLGAASIRNSQVLENCLISASYWFITVLIGALALLVVMFTKSLGTVFSLNGAIGCTLMCNLCPAWLYLAVAPADGPRALTAFAWCLLLYGLITMPVCISANFIG